MTWVKGILLILSLALNVYWATIPRSAVAHDLDPLNVEVVGPRVPEEIPTSKATAKVQAQERPPLPAGHLRMSSSNLDSLAGLCFTSDEWQLSELAVSAFELTPVEEAQVNQALGDFQAEIFRLEAGRVQKHSDWYYTLGALTEDEVNRLRENFRSNLDNHLEVVQAEALTALAFNHGYFMNDPHKEMDIAMMPYRDHLEVQFGNPNVKRAIPYSDPFKPIRRVKRLSHLIDFEPVWHQAFEETSNLRTPK